MRNCYLATTPPTLQLEGCLELGVAEALQQLLRRSLAATPEGLQLDLRGVEWIDCRALGVLLVACRQARRRGQPLLLAPSPRVRRLAELCGVADQLQFTAAPDDPQWYEAAATGPLLRFTGAVRGAGSRTGAAGSPAGHR